MSPREKIRKYVYDGITHGLELTRIEDNDLIDDFKDKEDDDSVLKQFRARQDKIIDDLSEPQIERALAVIQLIESGISIMDKEYMNPFYASGFCFDHNGDIVIFAER